MAGSILCELASGSNEVHHNQFNFRKLAKLAKPPYITAPDTLAKRSYVYQAPTRYHISSLRVLWILKC